MDEIKGKLSEIILGLYGVEILPEVSVAPEGQKGASGRKVDYATNVVMRLAGELKRAPREIGEEIREKFLGDSGDFEVEVAGPGFLNFISSDEYFKRKLGDLSEHFLENIACDEYEDKVVVSEFSDPNPFKVLHVGHLYTSIVGEAVSRLVEFAGGEVRRANFGGDVGLHVAKTLYSLVNRLEHSSSGRVADARLHGVSALGLASELRTPSEEALDDSPATIAGILAECYVEGTRAYEEDREAHEDIVYLNKMIYEIAEKGKPDKVDISRVKVFKGSLREAPRDELLDTISELYWWGREASYEYFKEFYSSIGLKFDKYYPESTVAQRGLAVVKEQLKNGVYEMSDGAVVFRGESYGLHTRVFINKEGLPTYEAKDVGLIHAKWDDYHFDESIVITGNDIIDYMKVVLTSVAQYNPELVERTKHVTHGNVKLKGGVKMSSRKGNFLKAVDVIEMVNGALEKEQGERSEVVAMGAMKYAFLKYKIGGDIIFSPEESVSMVGNSGPYLQYATLRAKKILSSIGSENCPSRSSSGRVDVARRHGDVALGRRFAPASQGANGRDLRTPSEEGSGEFSDDTQRTFWTLSEYERELMRKILEYREVLAEAVGELAPHKICGYLYELAQVFNRFYENVKVRGSEFEAERAVIVSVYLATLTHGLDLLGIEIPERM